jgi:general stress protein CsbA
MVVCLIGYIVAGFTKNPWISLALGVVLIVVSVLVLHKISGNKKAA